MNKQERRKLVRILEADIVTRCRELLRMTDGYPELAADEIEISVGYGTNQSIYIDPSEKLVCYARPRNDGYFRYQGGPGDLNVRWCENLPQMQKYLITAIRKLPQKLKAAQKDFIRKQRDARDQRKQGERELVAAVKISHSSMMNDFLIGGGGG